MEVIIIFAIIVAGLVGLDVAATTWGADSRGTLPDDHTR